MTWDSAGRPSPSLSSEDIPQERVDRVVGAVLARLETCERPAAVRRTDVVGLLSDWLAGLRPATRFAMPMAAAALLGVMVSQRLQAAESAVQISDLLSYTSLYATGF